MKQYWRKTRAPVKEKPVFSSSTKSKSSPGQYTPGILQVSLANILHLNVEQGGNLIFRTHWFILLKQIGPPSLAMLVVIVLLILRMMDWFEVVSIAAFSALLLLIGLVIAGWWLYQFIDWNNDLCIVTQDQVVDIDRTPLGNEEKRVAPLKAILSIDYERLGLIGLVLNYGSVNVRTGGDMLTIQHVYNPSEVARMIFERYDRLKLREKMNEQEMGWRNTGEFIRAYEDVKQEGNPSLPQENPPSDAVSG